MAVTREKTSAGFSVPEILLGFLITAGIAASISASVRVMSVFRERERAQLERRTARAIVKEAFARAILGATRFVPEPVFRLDGAALTVAEILPEAIYQRLRTPGAPAGAFCRTATGIPKPDGTDQHIALAISADAHWLVRTKTFTTAARCPEGRALKLEITEIRTPLNLTRGAMPLEALMPVRDVYSLSVDSNGSLRRKSHITTEHQEVWHGIDSFEFSVALSPPSFAVSFSHRGSANNREVVTLPFASGGRADWLDYIW